MKNFRTVIGNIIVFLLVAGGLFGSLKGAEFSNGDFTRFTGDIPIAWSLDGNAVQCEQAPTGGVQMTVLKPTTNDASLSQALSIDSTNKAFLLTGEIQTQTEGIAYIQVKFFKNKKELRRLASTMARWGTTSIRLPFNTGEADSIQINCRMATTGNIGAQAIFTGIELKEIPPESFFFWRDETGENRVSSDNENSLTTVLRSSKNKEVMFRHDLSKSSSANWASEMEFSATVKSDFIGITHLRVELYENGTKTNEFLSSSNRFSVDRCRVRFPVGSADRISFFICIDGGEIYVGERIVVEEFRFGIPETGQTDIRPERQATVVPGYQVCSVYLRHCKSLNEADFTSQLSYRQQGEKQWLPALELQYIPAERTARGSLVKLHEGTTYEVRLEYTDAGESHSIIQSFRTKEVAVPIAKTIHLSASDIPLVIKESGTPQGYIRYTTAPGVVLDAKEIAPYAILMNGVSYVILDGLTIRGGQIDAISVNNASHIQVTNCDMAGFGRVGIRRDDFDGKFYLEGSTRALNNDAGIRLFSSHSVLIERNFIHDPRGTSNSWFYSHPSGPNALVINDCTDVALRYNDFIGSDEKRWNDAIESGGNGSNTGSIWQDAEIVGNYFAFGDDDGMELDGGQVNCRFFYNRTEGCLCGVSTAPCRKGPSYLFQNVFCNPGDEYDLVGAGIKNNYGNLGRGRIYFFNNTIIDHSTAMSSPGGVALEYDAVKELNLLKGVGRNNLAVTGSLISTMFFDKIRGDFDFDLFDSKNADREFAALQKLGQENNGLAATPLFANKQGGIYSIHSNSPGYQSGASLPNFLPQKNPSMGAFQEGEEPKAIPYRPVPYYTDQATVLINQGGDTPQRAFVTILVEDTSFESDFEITQPEGADFFEVTPQRGKLSAGKPITLTIRSAPNRINQARRHTSAFCIRTTNGFSRPVSVTVDSRANPRLLKNARRDVIRGECHSGVDGSVDLIFDVPTTGGYWLFARPDQSSARWYFLAVDGGKALARIALPPFGATDPWINVSAPVFGGEENSPNRPLLLEKGRHTLTLFPRSRRDKLIINEAALTQDADSLRLAPDGD